MNTTPSAQKTEHNDEIDLVDLIGALWDGKWIIIGLTALVTLLGAVYVYTTPPPPTARLTFEVSSYPQQYILGPSTNSHDADNLKSQLVEISNNALFNTDWPQGLSLTSVSQKEETTQITASFTVSDAFSLNEIWLPTTLGKINAEIGENFPQEIADPTSEARLRYLSDQLEIAHAIGQTKHIFQTGTVKSATFLTTEGLPFYLNGSIAIETEIAQIKRKTLDFKAKLGAVKSSGAKFLSASQNDFVVTTPARSTRIILLAFLVGGFMSLVVLVVWRSLQTYWKRGSQT